MNYLKNIFILACCYTVITNAEILDTPKSKLDFATSKVIQENNGILVVNGKSNICAKKIFPIDPNKQYKISLEYKFSSLDSKESLRFGFMQYGKNKAMIHPAEVLVNKGSETILLQDIKAKDKVIYVKDASKWKGNSASKIALRVDPSGKLRDLPNRNILPAGIKKIEQKDGQYLIHLYSSAQINVQKNTAIREHLSGWYGLGLLKLTPSTTWKKISFTTTKGTTEKNSNLQWNKHAKYGSFFIMANCQNIQLKSITIESIDLPTAKK